MSHSHINTALNPQKKLISILAFLSQFQVVDAQNNSQDSSMNIFLLSLGGAFLLICLAYCTYEARNRARHPERDIEMPLLSREAIVNSTIDRTERTESHAPHENQYSSSLRYTT
jgi:hypothetical protein